MSREYDRAFKQLNQNQLEAVESVDGPVLVIAGPGTGKTQLISVRVGHILKQTDTPANAILLLTFTEAGVQALRERLDLLVGAAGYDVQLNTYHAFGGEVFRQFPDYFGRGELNLIEELGTDTLLREIIAKLPYSNPLKFADSYINDLKNFISDSKRALLSPQDIGKVVTNNLSFFVDANIAAKDRLSSLGNVSKKTVVLFEDIHSILGNIPRQKLPANVQPIVNYVQAELESALQNYKDFGKLTQLSQWKNVWLEKNANGNFVFGGKLLNDRVKAATGIYNSYQRILEKRDLYDYDDMILRAIDALEKNRELKYSLAEKYSYILLDEFQDTNPAQFRLVQLLTDHPVNEGRPNVMAVGDDDQAIYAFQGAEQANMANFVRHYKDVKIISLKKNYRSSPEIIEIGQKIISQVKGRLHDEFIGIDKSLVQGNQDLSEPAVIEMRHFKSDAAQYSWIATEISKMMEEGIPGKEIAVLAPKHRFIEPLLTYLARLKIDANYERRENILDGRIVLQLEQMSRLVVALAEGNETLANSLWPQILSYDFWKVATDRIWRISWQSRESHEPWTGILLNDPLLRKIAVFFLRLAEILPTTSLEEQIDILLGVPKEKIEAGEYDEIKMPIESPLFKYHFSGVKASKSPYSFVKLIGDLSVLRSRLDNWQHNYKQRSNLRTLVEFIEGHRAAGINIVNTVSYHENRSSVNLLTAYGAKGREFRAVFIAAAIDEVWGSSSRNQGYRLSLPANLSFIRYQGASEDERLRLLYVAATRARTRLLLTSYEQDLSGKKTSPLKYLAIEQEGDYNFRANTLPPKYNHLIIDKSPIMSTEDALSYWTSRHQPPFSSTLREVLNPKLQRYQLSPTDLIKFLDVTNGGPERFFLESLLGFPRAPSLIGIFGTALHNTIRSIGFHLRREGKLPNLKMINEIFNNQLSKTDILADDYQNLLTRGHDSLKTWFKERGSELKVSDRYEYNFSNEGSSLGPVRLTGRIDRLAIDEKTKSLRAIDYKIGRSYKQWRGSVLKLHQFRQQLLFYKLVVSSSRRFKNYGMESGSIEFVEPDTEGNTPDLEIRYTEEELNEFGELVGAVWDSIQSLNFPKINKYPATLAGIKKFESDLINKKTPAGSRRSLKD